MPFERLASLIDSLPSAAAMVTVAPSGSANTYGNWVEVVASAPSDLFIAGIFWFDPATFGGKDNSLIFQVGKGAAASEVGLAEFLCWRYQIFGYGTDPSNGVLLAGIPISGISNGDRIAVRNKANNTDATNYTFGLLYLPNPITGTLETTANPLKASPIIQFTCSATPWANAASFVELIASTAAALVINHFAYKTDNASECEIDIATGGAGAETVIYTLRTDTKNDTSLPGITNLPILFDNIGNGVRVSMRVRSSLANCVFQLGLGYYEKPL